MSTRPTVIVGAGLAGLIAAHAWPQAAVLERMAEPRQVHRALLRFRSDAVARLTGIEFRKVLVRKGIWHAGHFVPPNIQLANWYALKCTGVLSAERSIWNLDPVERWVAPDDLYEQLLDYARPRIEWGVTAGRMDPKVNVVSTAPLSDTIMLLGDKAPQFHFQRAAITVRRLRLPADADVYQTVYFPAPHLRLYRASVTGRVLILEFTGSQLHPSDLNEGYVQALTALGLSELHPKIDTDGPPVEQRFGKIVPLSDDAARKHALFLLTHEHSIYSLGRFATWRNILLDDVVRDIDMIKRLMRSGSAYDQRHGVAQ